MRLLHAFDASAELIARCGAQSMPFAVAFASPFGTFDPQPQTASRNAFALRLQHVAAAAYSQPLEPTRPDSRWSPANRRDRLRRATRVRQSRGRDQHCHHPQTTVSATRALQNVLLRHPLHECLCRLSSDRIGERHQQCRTRLRQLDALGRRRQQSRRKQRICRNATAVLWVSLWVVAGNQIKKPMQSTAWALYLAGPRDS